MLPVSYTNVCVNDMHGHKTCGGVGGGCQSRNCWFLGDIEPRSEKPAENWTFGISFIVDVALAKKQTRPRGGFLTGPICISPLNSAGTQT